MNGCHETTLALRYIKEEKKGLLKLLNALYSTQTGPSISIMVLETPGRAMEIMESIRHECVWRFISICHRPMNWEGFCEPCGNILMSDYPCPSTTSVSRGGEV